MKNMKTKISKTFSPAAFTLIELLVVISIISVLAGLIIGGLGAARNYQYRSTAKAELTLIQAAIDDYQNKSGSYPPSNTNDLSISPLYYELSGATYNSSTTIYQTLDSAASITAANFFTAYKIGGIVNTTRGSGEDEKKAVNFLPGLKANLIESVASFGIPVTNLVSSVRGPDNPNTVNAFHYNSFNPTNNPSSYDLWVDLVIKGKTYRIGNWTAK